MITFLEVNILRETWYTILIIKLYYLKMVCLYIYYQNKLTISTIIFRSKKVPDFLVKLVKKLVKSVL